MPALMTVRTRVISHNWGNDDEAIVRIEAFREGSDVPDWTHRVVVNKTTGEIAYAPSLTQIESGE